MGARVQALDASGELRQLAQQRRLLVARRAAYLGGDLRQVALGVAERGRDFARHRQAEQRRHPVGLDLEQALHRASEALRAQHPDAQQLARVAVGMQPEVGVDLRLAVGDGGAD
jgi:hypothetical protein